jgi:hypothetical protein
MARSGLLSVVILPAMANPHASYVGDLWVGLTPVFEDEVFSLTSRWEYDAKAEAIALLDKLALTTWDKE